MRVFLSIAAVILIAGCVRPPTAMTPDVPVTERPIAPVPLAGDWRDWPVTPGSWRYRQAAGASLAQYGLGNALPLVTLRCDSAAGTVTIVRPSADAPATIRTTSVTRTVPLGSTGAALTARDPLLDAMAFSRGRFVIEQAGAATLVLPSWAEVGRVIEDCRR